MLPVFSPPHKTHISAAAPLKSKFLSVVRESIIAIEKNAVFDNDQQRTEILDYYKHAVQILGDEITSRK